MTNVTHILGRLADDDPSAAEKLLPLVYGELRKLAAARMADERSDHTLQPTALVHEAYLRLVDGEDSQHWNSRGHFFGAAAEAMRRILVDSARRRQAEKRGGDRFRVSFKEGQLSEPPQEFDLLEIDRVLKQLEAEQPDLGKLVSLRFFAGLTMAQAAESLGIPLRTAERNWTYVKAWILEELSQRQF